MTLQLARELTKKHGITVFGISPNKLRGTEMSQDIEDQVVALRGWTREYAAQYQLNALLAGEETDPAQLADFVAHLLSTKPRHKFLTGCILPYGA
jgi:NAD(P)-dependent dehydrogenase (short-subunit alcohol dehydrogenase family)